MNNFEFKEVLLSNFENSVILTERCGWLQIFAEDWVSVKDLMPPEFIEHINDEGEKVASSPTVAVVGRDDRGIFMELSRTMNGCWAGRTGVSHWFPLPILPPLSSMVEEV